MKSKKLFTLGLTILSITTLSFSSLYAMELNQSKIKTNVVYSVKNNKVAATDTTTKNTTSDTHSPYDDIIPLYTITDSELQTYYVNAGNEAFKKYFNLTPDSKQVAETVLISEDSIHNLESHLYEYYEAQYNAGELSSDVYNSRKESIPRFMQDDRKQLELLNHDFVMCRTYSVGQDGQENEYYIATFNANTKELIAFMNCSSSMASIEAHDSDITPQKPKTLSIDEQKSITSDFIKTHQLGGIQNPKFIKHCQPGYSFFIYEDANDSSKKVVLSINDVDGKIINFYVNSGVNYILDQIN